MKDRVRRLLVAALLASPTVLAAGCGLLPSNYNLEIRPTGTVASELQTVYVIVSRNEVVADALSSPSKYEDLVDEKVSKNYESFVVYRPMNGSWKEEQVGKRSTYVTQEVDGESIEIKVDHDLIEDSGMTQYNVVVLAFYGSDGFELVKVDHANLEASGDQVIEVSGGTLSLRDG